MNGSVIAGEFGTLDGSSILAGNLSLNNYALGYLDDDGNGNYTCGHSSPNNNCEPLIYNISTSGYITNNSMVTSSIKFIEPAIGTYSALSYSDVYAWTETGYNADMLKYNSFSQDIRYCDHGHLNYFTSLDAIIDDLNAGDSLLESTDTVVRNGSCDIVAVPNTFGFVVIQNGLIDYNGGGGDGLLNSSAAIINDTQGASDRILESTDIVVRDGEAFLLQFNQSFGYSDNNNNNAFNTNEAIINDTQGSFDTILESTDYV